MKKIMTTGLLILLAVTLAGCETWGLSTREQGSNNYANYIYGLYHRQPGATSAASKMQKPIKLAVAQVGENAPPKIMLDQLDQRKDLFASISVVPIGVNEAVSYYGDRSQEPPDFSAKMDKVLALGKDLGVDYLFIFGGSADSGERQSWLGVLDISIIGMFIIPTHKIVTEGKAAGALVDIESGKVILMVNSQEEKKLNATTFNLSGKKEEALTSLRDALVDALTKQFVNKLSRM